MECGEHTYIREGAPSQPGEYWRRISLSSRNSRAKHGYTKSRLCSGAGHTVRHAHLARMESDWSCCLASMAIKRHGAGRPLLSERVSLRRIRHFCAQPSFFRGSSGGVGRKGKSLLACEWTSGSCHSKSV